MGGGDAFREPFVIDAEEFIGVKTFKAKGRRVTNWEVANITEIEPREPQPADDANEEPVVAPTDENTGDDTPNNDRISQEDVLDEFTGQQHIPFDDL